MISEVYVHVKKENGVLKVKRLKKHFSEQTNFLFREEDQEISKHPMIANCLKGKDVADYRNVKVSGTSLSTYYDYKTEKFVFNGVELNKDEHESFTFSKEGTFFYEL